MEWHSHTSHPPNATRRGVGTRLTSLLTCCHARAENRTVRHQAELDKAPKGNRQLARKGDNHDLPYTLAMPRRALQEPARERTLRLIPNPQPGGLNHNGTHAATP